MPVKKCRKTSSLFCRWILLIIPVLLLAAAIAVLPAAVFVAPVTVVAAAFRPWFTRLPAFRALLVILRLLRPYVTTYARFRLCRLLRWRRFVWVATALLAVLGITLRPA